MARIVSVFIVLLALCLYSISLAADDCEYERTIELTLDLSGSESLDVIARAGKLVIHGESGSDEAEIEGRVCVSREEWLDEVAIETEDGRRARIEVGLPVLDRGFSLFGFGDRYARLDLELRVPDRLELDVKDSSGSMVIENVGAVSIKDSSGSIKVKGSSGPVSVKDSSGSISLIDIADDVTILSDSSGSIKGRSIDGSVLVKRDSSGSIDFSDVTGDFIVERDSSGDIVARRVGGDFTVLKDGSGSIHSSDVEGEVTVPER